MTYERKNVARMKGYVWGEQPDDARTLKLNTNENPFPPSPAVAKALAAFDVADLRRYPQPTADPLRRLIADKHDLALPNIVVTNGGDEALRLALTTFVEPGAGFGMLEPSYSLYPVLAEIQDARVVRVPMTDAWLPPDDAAEALNAAGVQLTCIVNPHAPSGRLLTPADVAALAESLDGVLLLDEAYVDFVDPALGHDCARLVTDLDNLLCLRTFSKGYSLAGLRLGYLLGHPTLIEPIITKTRDSYNIDGLSQALGAASLADQTYARQCWDDVRHARSALRGALGQLGLHAPESHANFLLVTVADEARSDARSLYEGLKRRDILVRYFDAPGLDDKLRITVGTPDENARLIDALADLLGA